MKYEEMKRQLYRMVNENYEEFVKALVSVEKGVNDKEALNIICQEFMEGDQASFLHEDFDYMIDDLREQGKIQDIASSEIEQDDLLNIVGNVVGEVEVVNRENKDGKPFTVVNFSIVSKDDEGNKSYMNCSAYGEKGDIPKDFQRGDFVKLFGQLRTSTDEQGKVYSSLRVLSSKLLKAKEQMKDSYEKKESVLGAIKEFKEQEKAENKPKEKSDKGQER
jgi:hypothetical protein